MDNNTIRELTIDNGQLTIIPLRLKSQISDLEF